MFFTTRNAGTWHVSIFVISNPTPQSFSNPLKAERRNKAPELRFDEEKNSENKQFNKFAQKHFLSLLPLAACHESSEVKS